MTAQLAAGGFLDPVGILEKGSYVLLFAIIFAESGLLIGFFLPGDSLIFTAGAVAAGAFQSQLPDFQLNIWIVSIGCLVAAVTGDQVGYVIGSKAGPRLFNRPDSRLFRQEYVHKGSEFFAHYGPKAIVLARFIPVVRTFVPNIAGVSKMDYSTFLRFNIVGCVILGFGVSWLGYLFGNIEIVQENFGLAILAIGAVSFVPIAIEVVRARRNARSAEE